MKVPIQKKPPDSGQYFLPYKIPFPEVRMVFKLLPGFHNNTTNIKYYQFPILPKNQLFRFCINNDLADNLDEFLALTNKIR